MSKSMKAFLAAAVCTAVVIACAALGLRISGYKISLAKKVYIDGAVPVMQIGDAAELPLEIVDVFGDTLQGVALQYEQNALNLIYNSSNTDVAVVDGKGTITAVGNGTATITAYGRHGKINLATSVEVHSVAERIDAEDIALTDRQSNIPVQYTAFPEGADLGTVTMTSSNDAVFVVTANGTITPTSAGTATLTIRSDVGVEKTITVTVSKIPESISGTTMTMHIGDYMPIEVDDEGANLSYTYKSSDNLVAGVDAAGNVLAMGLGTATIEVENSSYGLKTSVTVQVVKNASTIVYQGGDEGVRVRDAD